MVYLYFKKMEKALQQKLLPTILNPKKGIIKEVVTKEGEGFILGEKSEKTR